MQRMEGQPGVVDVGFGRANKTIVRTVGHVSNCCCVTEK